MLSKQFQRGLSLLLCLALAFTIIGCQKKAPAKPMTPKKESSGQKAKPPKTAESMSKEMDKILQALDKKARQERMPQMSAQTEQPAKPAESSDKQANSGSQGQKQSGSSGQKQQSGQQQDGSSGQQQQSGQQQGQKAQPTNKQPTPSQEWQSITMSLLKIHQTWNEIEPEAIKAGMTSEDRDAFESSLDKLTQAASEKKLPESMKAAVDLYRNFGTVVSYFAYPLPRDFFIVNYEVMSVMVAAFTNNWTTADQHIKNLEEPWLRLQMQLDKEQKADADRTGFSIKDLTQAVAQKDVNLTFIKGEIVIKNLQKLKEKLSKKEEQGQG